jgi:hypothetical protein
MSTGMNPERVPLLQIIHVSDLHFGPPDVSDIETRTWLGTLCQAAYSRRGEEERQGLAGLDQFAVVEFETCLDGLMTHEGEWKDDSWLIATGDLSTWGDAESIADALGFLQRAAQRHDIRWAALYGNHDVWPGDPPLHPLALSATPSDLSARRTAMRTNFFPMDWPLHPVGNRGGHMPGRPQDLLSVGFKRRTGRLVVYSLNTVVHNSGLNGWALGAVARDRYWQTDRNLPDQVDQVSARWQQGDFGIVLTHHPIHHPNAPLDRDVLVNRENVARRLSTALSIVVSGHTHVPFPPEGDLNRLGACDPLGAPQVQLITGTLSQIPQHIEFAQTWQRLRFFEEEDAVVLQRVLYTRSDGEPFNAGRVDERRFARY